MRMNCFLTASSFRPLRRGYAAVTPGRFRWLARTTKCSTGSPEGYRHEFREELGMRLDPVRALRVPITERSDHFPAKPQCLPRWARRQHKIIRHDPRECGTDARAAAVF